MVMSLKNTQKYVLHILPLASARMGIGLGQAEQLLLWPLPKVGFPGSHFPAQGEQGQKALISYRLLTPPRPIPS